MTGSDGDEAAAAVGEEVGEVIGEISLSIKAAAAEEEEEEETMVCR